MLLTADLFERVSMNAHRSAKFCRDWAAMQVGQVRRDITAALESTGGPERAPSSREAA